MKQYLDIVKDVLENGTDKEDRTGVGSRSVFGRCAEFDLTEGFPLVTTRKVPFRLAFEETMFFLRGETDTTKLEEKNVNIWKGNTSREFLDNRGLTHLPEGDMGKGYGFQWRNFGGADRIVDEDYNTVAYGTEGTDQIYELYDGLINNPYSRRHIVSAWNPQQLSESALPPCHVIHQYQVMNGYLNSSFMLRSNDIYLGLPFNIAGYAFLNLLLAQATGLKPGKLVYFGGDVHLYSNSIKNAKLLVQREPLPLPTLTITKDIKTFDDMLAVEWEDVELSNYEFHPDLPKVEMAI